MPMKLPKAVLDQCVGHKVWIVMKGKRQFSGIFRGFDDYLNTVIQEVSEVWQENNQKKMRKHESILLNGHDIAYFVPGTDPLRSKTEVSDIK